MKELSREEQLRKQIEVMRKVNEKRKWERVKNTFFVLSGVVYVIAFSCGEMSGDIKAYLAWLIIAPVFAVIIMCVSLLVLMHINSGALEDEETVARLEGKLSEITSSDEEWM